MVKVDISLWDNVRRLRERVKNVSTMVMSLSAVNGFYVLGRPEINWIMFGINCIFFFATLPVFISYSKWQKLPPKEVDYEIKTIK